MSAVAAGLAGELIGTGPVERCRPPLHEPADRLGHVLVDGIESDMEVVGHYVVLDQVIEGIGQPGARHRAVRRPLRSGPAMLVRLRVEEPGPPARRVDRGGDRDQAQEVADPSREDALQEPRPGPRTAQRQDVPHDHQDADRRQQIQPGPLDRAGQADGDARRQQPRAQMPLGCEMAGGGARQVPGEPRSRPLPIPHQAVHRQD